MSDMLNRYLMASDSYSDFLCHHGILGQKWGVRRFQNPDGTLTEAGKKRYYNTDGKSGDHHYTKEGAKEAGKDLTKLSKIALKEGKDSDNYKKQISYIKTKWGEGPDGVSDWAGEYKGATDKADKIWDKAKQKNGSDSIEKEKTAVNVTKLLNSSTPYKEIKERLPKDTPEYKAYESAKKQLDDAWKPMDDYHNNKEEYTKYATKAALKFWSDAQKRPDWGDWHGEDKKQVAIDWFINDDGDQGDYDSFKLYAKDKGIDTKKIDENIRKASAAQSKARDNYVNSVLGSHVNDPVTYETSWGYDRKTGKIVKKKVTTTAGKRLSAIVF